MREFVITKKVSPAFGGRHFGEIGQYEQLSGYAIGEADPAHPQNAGIVNLTHAPRNADGNVEYKVDINILRPLDPAKANGWLFYEIINRGFRRAVARLNTAPPGNESDTAEQAGNGYLMNHGYTMVWSGWQNDLPDEGGHMHAAYPIATNPDNSPITGQSLEEIIEPTNARTFTYKLNYPAADTATPASLTVRERERDPRQTPPGLSWRYVDDTHIEVTRPDDPQFDAGAIFEFIYTAKNPTVNGLAFASVRDITGFLRQPGKTNPIADIAINHTMLFGISQSGRFVRDFLYQGFNQSLDGSRVFDAAVPLVAGSRRTFINYPFAQPGRYQRQHEDHNYPGDQFPFAYREVTDPISGKTDSLLAQCDATGTTPKIMHVDSESELWQARSSLVVTDCDGNDIDQSENVRVYLTPGIPHGQAGIDNPETAQLPLNLMTYGFLMRALLVALREWVENGTPPPPSAYPSHADSTLVRPDKFKFPAVPGLDFAALYNGLRLMNHSTIPPKEGAAYPVFVSTADELGNGNAGLKHPALLVPKATILGWNLRAKGHGEGELLSTIGGQAPLPSTKAERVSAKDPRPAIDELYADNAAYAGLIRKAAEPLVAARILLREDADAIVAAAERGDDIQTAV